MDDKIYSRKRLLIPKLRVRRRKSGNFSKKQRNRNVRDLKKINFSEDGQELNTLWGKNNVDRVINRKLIKTAIIISIAVFIANRLISAIEPTMDILCIDMAKSIATRISNEQATVVMGDYQYEDISEVIRDEQGNIKMIQMNVVTVNAITSDIALKIQEGLNNYQSGEFYIKLGTFTGTKILAGRGPNIPIKMSTVGNVETELISQFSQAGINQTLHRIYLNVSCNVTILTPFDSIEQNIMNQVLLAEAVIVGDVPSTYYNLNGIDNDKLIELVE